MGHDYIIKAEILSIGLVHFIKQQIDKVPLRFPWLEGAVYESETGSPRDTKAICSLILDFSASIMEKQVSVLHTLDI